MGQGQGEDPEGVRSGHGSNLHTEFQQCMGLAAVADPVFRSAVEDQWARSHDLVEVPAWVAVASKQQVMIQADGMVEPVGIKQAMRLPEWESWKAAVEKEVRGLFLAGVWDEIPRSEVPAERRVVPSHFIFRIKMKEDPKTKRLVVEKLKARLVFGGHRSEAGVDYHETAAYTASAKSVRTVCALAARRGWKVVTYDIAQAFALYPPNPRGMLVTCSTPH